MYTSKFLIVDKNDEFYDIYLFEVPVSIDKLNSVIIETKQKEDYTLEDIEKTIREHFPVAEVILFDYGSGTIFDI